jgi:hypothetical protein
MQAESGLLQIVDDLRSSTEKFSLDDVVAMLHPECTTEDERQGCCLDVIEAVSSSARHVRAGKPA